MPHAWKPEEGQLLPRHTIVNEAYVEDSFSMGTL